MQLAFFSDGWSGSFTSRKPESSCRSPTVSGALFTTMTEAVLVIGPEIIGSICDGNLFSNLNVLHSPYFHAIVSSGNQTSVGITVVVCKTSRTKKDRPILSAARK